MVYKQRHKLEDDELKKYCKTTKRVHPDRRKLQQGEKYCVDLCRTHFDRIRHMTPERDRLARTLFLPAQLQSPEGISAIRDLIALRTNDCRVAYQDVLQPVHDRHNVSRCRTCHTVIERYRVHPTPELSCTQLISPQHPCLNPVEPRVPLSAMRTEERTQLRPVLFPSSMQ